MLENRPKESLWLDKTDEVFLLMYPCDMGSCDSEVNPCGTTGWHREAQRNGSGGGGTSCLRNEELEQPNGQTSQI